MPVAVNLRRLKLSGHRTGLSGSKNTKQNKALQSLKRQSVGVPSFAKINSCTYRLDRPEQIGAGWLMDVGTAWGGRRADGLHESEIGQVNRCHLAEAKWAAVAMLSERGEAEPRDWIAELNKIAAAEVDRVALTQVRKQWPRDLVGARSRPGSMQIDAKLRDAILDAELLATTSHAEPLSGDGFRLEFYDDGYPKLPECLRRKQAS